MMNYDGFLSQLTEEKLSIFPRCLANEAETAAIIPVEEGAVEEEQAAIIQTVQLPRVSTAARPTPVTRTEMSTSTSTPQRKISTSSRFMNAFQQFYGGSSTSSASATNTENDDNDTGIAVSVNTAFSSGRTPTKGMESKLLSMWHNVKYGWSSKLRPNFSKEQPVWLLGRCYHRKYTPPSSMESSTELSSMSCAATSPSAAADNKILGFANNSYETGQQVPPNVPTLYPVLNPQEIDEIVVPQELGMDVAENQVPENPWEEGIEGFRRDFYSRIWMTYRREFPTMNGTNYTSDCGWGCMLRSGQMLLAQGLLCHFLGRTWRFDAETQLHVTLEDNMHKKIIKWFGDSSSKNSPFSIHALVDLGEARGKKPGDWYGPASVSFLLKEALKNAAQEIADFDNITIYVARDCTIYMQDVEDECCIRQPARKECAPWQRQQRKEEPPKPEKPVWKSLIILIPLRLGTEKLNPSYAHSLKLLLSTEYCIGIIGGRPKHSLYFVGFQEDKLIHLDPHYCQEMVDVSQENFSLQSFHCKSPRKLKVAKMDPSCCIGFYCATKADFDNFVESVQMYLLPMRGASATGERPSASSSQQPSNADTQYTEMSYPLFTFSRGRCLENERNEMSDSLYKPLQQQLSQLSKEMATQSYSNSCSVGVFDMDDDEETEEFVLL